jgi:hypothetical protein
MNERTYDIHGTVVRVTSDRPEHLARLDDDFGTFTTDGGRRVDPELHYEIRARTPEEVGLPPVAVGPLGDVVTEPGDGVLRLSGPGLTEPAAYITEVRAYFAAAVFSRLVRLRPTRQIHASAVRGGQGGVAFIGHKKAGKTSMALLALTAGADFVSNDITFLEAAADGVHVLGIPQTLTLGPGAVDWFGRHAPQTGIDAPPVGEVSAEELYNMEGRNKYALRLPEVAGFATVVGEAVELGHIVFPEPGMALAEPRAVRLTPDEAQVRLCMHSEAMTKWGWPPELRGRDYLRRLEEVTAAATRATACWLFQWCPDHGLNRKLIADLVL